MRPSDDDEEFLHNIIHEGIQNPAFLDEDDGSQYFNDGEAEPL
jgi:hypothetical protein